MSEDLYNERIIAEARSKKGAGRLDDAQVSVDCDNPLCGDRIRLDLRLEGGRITGLAHKTRGCLLTEAAASLMARLAAGASAEEVRALRRTLESVLEGEAAPLAAGGDGLSIFAPVAAVKSRHECVRLPFDALEEALRESGEASSSAGQPLGEG